MNWNFLPPMKPRNGSQPRKLKNKKNNIVPMHAPLCEKTSALTSVSQRKTFLLYKNVLCVRASHIKL